SNTTLRPSTAVTLTVISTVLPRSVAARWRSAISAPTESSPASQCSSSRLRQGNSMSLTSRGVAETRGSSPMKPLVRSLSTVMRLVRDTPGRRVSFMLFAPCRAHVVTRSARSFLPGPESASALLRTPHAWLARHLDQVQRGTLVARPEATAVDSRELDDRRLALQHGELSPSVEVPDPQRSVRRLPVPVAQALRIGRVDRCEQELGLVHQHHRSRLAGAVLDPLQLFGRFDVPDAK